MSNQKIFDTMVKQLGSELRHGNFSLKSVPQTVRCVLGENVWKEPMWRSRIDAATGEVYEFQTFEDFVETPPIKGLGATMDMLRSICKDDPVAKDMLDQAVQRPAHRPQGTVLNQCSSADEQKPRDTSTQNLRRIRKDRPDLHAKVLSKELTVTKAAVMAGFYPDRRAISLSSPTSAAATIRKYASPEFISELRKLLDD